MKPFVAKAQCGLLFLAMVAVAAGGPLTREANTTLSLPLSAPISGYGITNLLGNLVFDQPVCLASPPGETNTLFILERPGRIYVVTNLATPTKTLFLDLRSRVQSAYLETGLLGMDFHPNYNSNRYFYVYRTLITSTEGAGNVLHDQLSRFEVSPVNHSQALPDSEVVIFAQYDTSDEHNAGDVHFGPDGYLYVSLGEEIFPAGQLVVNHQPINRKLHGAIIRIDVDKRPGSLPPNLCSAITTNYAIPPDNPFVGVTNYQGFTVNPSEIRTEFYAIGFRNPWRFSFDPLTGDLYCGDVGGSHYEEVSVISPGGNYGWPYREGIHPFVYEPPPDFVGIDPVIEYSHGNKTNEGNCVTGGVVYRGAAIPQLYGWYVFGDYVRGHIWATHYDGTPGAKPFYRLTGDLSLSAFGYDPRDGEIIFANLHEGRIKKLVYVPPDEAAPFPQTLAQTGAFQDLESLTPYPGIVPYDVNVPFWSDNAQKRRWFRLPDSSKFGFHADGNWDFPPGTIWIKHFELETTNGLPSSRRKLETRFIVKGTENTYGVTYIWDAAQTNATLAPQEGLDQPIPIYNPDGTIVRTQVWHYPSQMECRTCHNPSAGHALGFSTAQLNRDHDYEGITTNQLLALSQADYLNTNLASVTGLRALYKATDTSKPLYDRARSYFQANCYACHHPGSVLVNSSYWDPRVHVPLEETHIVNNYYVTPRDLSKSWIYERINERGEAWQMPPISSFELDHTNIDLIRDWILGFPAPPWSYTDIGNTGREGSSSILAGEFQVAGAGVESGLANDAFHFLSRPLTSNGYLVARLRSQQTGGTEARAGLMLRNHNGTGSPYVMLSRFATGTVQFEGRPSGGAELQKTSVAPSQEPAWLRLVREGKTFTGYVSADATNWVEVGEFTADLADTVGAGFGVTSDDENNVNLARFSDFSMVAIDVAASYLPGQDVAPAHITLKSSVSHTGTEISQVVFQNGTNILGLSSVPPYTIAWSNAPAGTHTITARSIDTNGLSLTSKAISVEVKMPPGQALFAASEPGTGGEWRGRFGLEGYALATDRTNLPSHITLNTEDANTFIWSTSAVDLRALARAEGSGYIAACWYSQDSMTFDLFTEDGALKKLTLYCVDWDSGGNRSQRIELLDGDTSAILSSQTLTNFVDGVYLTWKIRGHIRVRITPLAGNAVVSALFIDPVENAFPVVNIVSPSDGSNMTAPAHVSVQAEASDADGTVSRIEFFANTVKIGESTNAPYATEWEPLLVGNYTLVARAWDDLNSSQLSKPVNITVNLPGAWVKFVREDSTTQGDWRSMLGRNGYMIVNHASALPIFADVHTPARSFTWVDGVSDPRALQHTGGPLRIAACYVDSASFDLDATFLDGKIYQLALYFLDWDSTARQLRIDISDPGSGELLETREVRDFHDGKYLTWIVRGSLRFTITRLQGNAVVSAAFLDPAPSIEVWRSAQFPTAQLRNPMISGNLMDPDGDGRLNLFERAVGSDPLIPDSSRVFWASLNPPTDDEPRDIIVSYIRSKSADDIEFNLQGTSDWRLWNEVGSLFEPVDVRDNQDGETETVRMRMPDPSQNPLFLRLEVRESAQ